MTPCDSASCPRPSLWGNPGLPLLLAGAFTFSAMIFPASTSGQPLVAANRNSKSETMTPERAVAFFLLNSIYLGEWPADMAPASLRVARIGVLGTDSLPAELLGPESNNTLEKSLHSVGEIARKTWFANGSIVIKRSREPEALKDCHVVLLNTQKADEVVAALAAFKALPLVTIGYGPEFLELGGIAEIRFTAEPLATDKQLAYDLNLDALARNKLSFNTKFRGLATKFLQNGKRTANPLYRTKT